MNQHNWRPCATREVLEQMYIVEGMTQKEIALKLNVTQKSVFTSMRNLGVPRRVAAKRDQRGARNASWKKANAGYQALHLRVYALRGAPSRCETCGTTTARSYEWASITGSYEDPRDYRRLCLPCHRTMDNAIKNLGNHAQGR